MEGAPSPFVAQPANCGTQDFGDGGKFCKVAFSDGTGLVSAGFNLVQLFSAFDVAMSSAGWSFGRKLTGLMSHK